MMIKRYLSHICQINLTWQRQAFGIKQRIDFEGEEGEWVLGGGQCLAAVW